MGCQYILENRHFSNEKMSMESYVSWNIALKEYSQYSRTILQKYVSSHISIIFHQECFLSNATVQTTDTVISSTFLRELGSNAQE